MTRTPDNLCLTDKFSGPETVSLIFKELRE